MIGLAVAEFGQLGAAGESVGQHHRVRMGVHGGQQVVLGHCDRDVVVALLDPEVAGQSAAATDRGHLCPGSGEQCGVGAPAQH